MTNSKKDSELESIIDEAQGYIDDDGIKLKARQEAIQAINAKYITKEESDRRVLDQFNKSVELMKEILMENFHYRIMCGEIKDPTGKIDVNKALVEYQELEPERRKFADYIESLKELLNGDKDGNI